MATVKYLKDRYSKKRADLKKAFYVAKRQGFVEGNYKDTPEYRRVLKAEKSALYRYRNRDKIAEKRVQRLQEAKDNTGLTTVDLASGTAAFVFRGGKASGYMSLLQTIIKGRQFYGFVYVVRNDEGRPSKSDGMPDIRNPQFSIPSHFSLVSKIIDFILSDKEFDYLFLSTQVYVKVSYNANKVILTHTFDFSNAEATN